MSAVNFILSLARKTLAKQSKGITTIPNRMAVEAEAGEIAAILQNAGIPLNKADEFIKSEADLVRILNIIESTPPVMKEVPSGIRNTKSADIFELQMPPKKIDPKKSIMGGKQIPDDDLPPPGSRGGPDDIAAPVQSAEETIKNMIEAENKKGIASMRNRKMVKDAIDNMSPGFVKGDRKYNAQLVAEDLANKKFAKDFDDLDQRQQMDLYDEALKGLSEEMAQGGRAGFNDGGIDILKAEDEAFQRALEAFKYYQSMGGKKSFRDYLRQAGKKGEMFRAEGGRAGFVTGGVTGVTNLAIRLARGFMKVTGKKPNNEEIVKIIREAAEKDFARTVGNVEIDTPLKGVSETKATIRRMDSVDKDELKKAIDEYNFAQGGRAGYKVGGIDKARRAFLKTVGTIGAGIGALKTGLLGLGKGTTKQVAKEVITTPNAPGKPEWFDALVTRVINEGEDVTKQFGYKERMKVYTKPISETEEVTVYRDLDDNSVRVNYGKKLKIDDTKPYERGNIGRAINDPDQIDLIVREGENIEPDLKTGKGGGKTKASFEASEAEPRAVGGPEDADIEFDAIREVDNVDDLMQDVSSLEEFATGKKLTGDKAAKAKKKREDFQRFTEDPVEQAEYLENKYGPYDDSAMDDFASGGIARMLGE